MTLNTFHVAGRRESNVTLGIPRLKELFTTEGKCITVPVMNLPIKPNTDRRYVSNLITNLKPLCLSEYLEILDIDEKLYIAKEKLPENSSATEYRIYFKLKASASPSFENDSFDETDHRIYVRLFRNSILHSIKKKLGLRYTTYVKRVTHCGMTKTTIDEKSTSAKRCENKDYACTNFNQDSHKSLPETNRLIWAKKNTLKKNLLLNN